jgi:hypothetical protein
MSDEPTTRVPIKQQIQQRATNFTNSAETDNHDLDDWLQAESEIKGT